MWNEQPVSRRTFLRLVGGGVGLTLGGELLAACGRGQTGPVTGAASGTPQRGGTLRVGQFAEPQSLDPALTGGALFDRQPMFLVYEPLVTLDQSLNPQPALAESWEQPDATSFVLHLRQGVKFHDGTSFDASAVQANFERILATATHSPWRSSFSSISAVDPVDAHTVRFRFTAPEPQGLFLSALATEPGAWQPSPAAITQYGKDLARHPVGTGPFQFVEWIPNDHLTAKRYSGYWRQGRPYLNQVVYMTRTDESARYLDLRSGGLDLVDGIPPAEVATAQKNSQLRIFTPLSTTYWRIPLNVTRPPFSTQALRNAVAYAIDRQAIAQQVWYGLAQPTQSIIVPGTWAEDKGLAPLQRDVAKSRTLLQQGGQPNGFSFEMAISNDPVQGQVAQAIQAQLKQVGIDMSLRQYEQGEFRSKEGTFTASITTWRGRPDPDGNLYPNLHFGQNLNFGHYNNPDMDGLLDEARHEIDESKRRQLYWQIEKLAEDDGAQAVLYWEKLKAAASVKVQGFAPRPDGAFILTDTWLTS